nr:MlrC C-terminal domain-containing protein [Corynebacterium aquilae]
MDTRAPGEVTVTATVKAVAEDLFGGTCVRLDKGNLSFVVTAQRCQFSTLDMYRRLDIEPTEIDIIVVKIGYLEPELHAIQQDWMLALTPGGVDQDLIRLNHRRIKRPMFPFDPEMETELVLHH